MCLNSRRPFGSGVHHHSRQLAPISSEGHRLNPKHLINPSLLATEKDLKTRRSPC